jgi:uncharacterized damage-inducible protein DinB
MGQLSSDPLAILAAHDAWATRRLLEVCGGLSREQFHRRFPIGLGSLHDNLTHVVGVLRRWADRIEGRALRAPIMHMPHGPASPEAKERTAGELLAILEDAEADLRNVIERARADLGAVVEVVWPARGGGGGTTTYRFSKGAALKHLFTHGDWHRAQCVNMLKHLGAAGVSDRLPELAVTDWQVEAESPAGPA